MSSTHSFNNNGGAPRAKNLHDLARFLTEEPEFPTPNHNNTTIAQDHYARAEALASDLWGQTGPNWTTTIPLVPQPAIVRRPVQSLSRTVSPEPLPLPGLPERLTTPSLEHAPAPIGSSPVPFAPSPGDAERGPDQNFAAPALGVQAGRQGWSTKKKWSVAFACLLAVALIGGIGGGVGASKHQPDPPAPTTFPLPVPTTAITTSSNTATSTTSAQSSATALATGLLAPGTWSSNAVTVDSTTSQGHSTCQASGLTNYVCDSYNEVIFRNAADWNIVQSPGGGYTYNRTDGVAGGLGVAGTLSNPWLQSSLPKGSGSTVSNGVFTGCDFTTTATLFIFPKTVSQGNTGARGALSYDFTGSASGCPEVFTQSGGCQCNWDFTLTQLS